LKKFYACFETLLPKTKRLWENRYECGEGGWLHYRILTRKELDDIIKLIKIKKKPLKDKELP